jgi:hypothetical protein
LFSREVIEYVKEYTHDLSVEVAVLIIKFPSISKKLPGNEVSCLSSFKNRDIFTLSPSMSTVKVSKFHVFKQALFWLTCFSTPPSRTILIITLISVISIPSFGL